jgi:DNA-binding transcriptional MerR regulator/effector-binding domain-containing protein
VEGVVPIGRFAFLSRLTVKTLHHYDEIGLLRPAHIDRQTGYRYYRPGQVREAMIIKGLRSLDMPLDEVARVLAAWAEPEVVRSHLKRQQQRLEERLASAERQLAFLNRLLDEGGPMPYDIEVKHLRPQAVVTRRAVLRTEEATADASGAGPVGEVFASVAVWLLDQEVGFSWPAINLTHAWDADGSLDASYGFCVSSPAPEDDVFVYEVLPGGEFLSTGHVGRTDEMYGAYIALQEWLQDHHLAESQQPWRTLCFSDPAQTSPEEFRFEILVPLA